MNKPSTPRPGKSGKAGKAGKETPAAATPGNVERSKMMVTKQASSTRTQAQERVDVDMRHAMIAQAAYFRAERRGFADGGQFDDWVEAEREITRILDE